MCEQVWTQQATLVSWRTMKTLWKSRMPDASQGPAWLGDFAKMAALGPGWEPSSYPHYGSQTTAGFSLCFMAGQAHVPGGVRGHGNAGLISGQHRWLGPPRTASASGGPCPCPSSMQLLIEAHSHFMHRFSSCFLQELDGRCLWGEASLSILLQASPRPVSMASPPQL